VLNCSCETGSSAVQPVKGLGPETTTGGEAAAAEARTSVAAQAAAKR
jgi:hypothetical protein